MFQNAMSHSAMLHCFLFQNILFGNNTVKNENIQTDLVEIDITLDDFIMDLQLFAEEKTEPATPKRRREAREKGQVAKSRELVAALMILISFWSLKILGGSIVTNLMIATKTFLNFSVNIDSEYTIENLMHTLLYCMLVFTKALAPLLLITAAIAIAGNYFQVGFVFTLKPLAPNFNKINPIEGFKRLFSKNSFFELIKSILKIILIGYVVFDYLYKQKEIIIELINMSVLNTAIFIGDTIVNIGLRAAFVLFILAIIDYVYQRWDFEVNLRMSKQEIKEEYKQTEGNPQIKGKIREKQRQMSMMRMMAEVPKADVIITNPTHFAIAIKYDSNVSDAPLVLAKGKDLIALKIKDLAKENKVPIVENKPLAQALYKSVEIGGRIPEELFKAVAEVLAFVYSLRNR